VYDVIMLQLHSLPTRRSSDLSRLWACPVEKLSSPTTSWPFSNKASIRLEPIKPAHPVTNKRLGAPFKGLNSSAKAFSVCVMQTRSEEHTSELQSRFDLVCRLP